MHPIYSILIHQRTNEEGKGSNHINWKEKTISFHKLHDCLLRKSYGIFLKRRAHTRTIAYKFAPSQGIVSIYKIQLFFYVAFSLGICGMTVRGPLQISKPHRFSTSLFKVNDILFVYSHARPHLYFKSSLGHLQYLTQCCVLLHYLKSNVKAKVWTFSVQM